MLSRRSLLTLAVVASVDARSQPARPRPLRVGVDGALMAGALAPSLHKSVARDTGLAIDWVPDTSTRLLAALEAGEIDMSMTNAPALELQLERKGLAHDRRAIARGELLLIGPIEGRGTKRRDPVGLLGTTDIAAALAQLAASPSPFVTASDGSGGHLAEQALWRLAKTVPAGSAYVAPASGKSQLAHARDIGGYTLVERSVWLAQGAPKEQAVIVEGDPRAATEVHLMRPFRVSHPAAKLFAQWVAGPKGQRVVASTRGWRAVA